jgi:hypothetical protein
MSLSTINQNQDFTNVKVNQFKSGRNWNSNLKVDDIEGAKTKVPGYQFQNKANLSNQNWDIDRSGPRALHIGLNKPEYSLKNDDIDRCKPQFQKFKTKRVVNPMNPNYKLPKTELIPVEEPKFIRDNINNDDIEGAKPKKPKYFKTRDTMRVDDIEGTRTKPSIRRASSYNNFDYSDVTKNQFATSRMTNPLNPSYFHRTDENEVEEIGNIEGSKPKGAPVRSRGPNTLNLNVDDIEGTKAGTKGVRAFKNLTRRNFREINKTSDIEGTKAGSLKRAPNTIRMVNPLNPNYQILGAKEMGENYNEFNQASKVSKPVSAPVKTRKDNLQRNRNQMQPNLDKETFKRDISKFYGSNPAFMQEVDFKKIHKD